MLYTYTNLDQATAYSERLMKDELLPVHLKELRFMTANVHFLKGDYMLAKNKYRELLSMDLKPKL